MTDSQTLVKALDFQLDTQRCPICGHTERSNRNKKRFNCKSCGHKDHSDRGASVDIAVKSVKRLDWNVPALNNLPVVRKVSTERLRLS